MRVSFRSVHQRKLPVHPEDAAFLIDDLGGTSDELWPIETWSPLWVDGPLGIGADAGHGPLRYRVVAYEPERRVRFEFLREGPWQSGLKGEHWFDVVDSGGASFLRHTLEVKATGLTALRWKFIVLPLHDAMMAELMKRAEACFTDGPLKRPVRFSGYVRFLRDKCPSFKGQRRQLVAA
jgi:hypothetical protein